MITKDGIDLNVCAYCNTPIDELSRTVDHLYPKSRGGILSNKNKVPACGDCNKLKADMNVAEFKRAVSAMIFLEQTSHKKRISYLKKIQSNSEKIIQRIKDDKKHILRHSDDGSRQGGAKKKKRP
jgi:5-methylcytosine-specific restriction endonuclease McrA